MSTLEFSQLLGNYGEFVAAIAVVATLVYLAAQIRENSKQLRVTSINAMNELINYGFDPIYNSDRNTSAWLVGLASPEELNELDHQLFELFMARLMNSFQTAVTHHRHDALDQRDFDRYMGVYRSVLETPGGQRWLASIGEEFLDEDAIRMLDTVKSRKVISETTKA